VKQVYVDCTTWVVITVHKDAVADFYTTVLLLLVPICHRSHHLSLVMYGVKMTKEAHALVPALCEMVKHVYIYHFVCSVFAKRQLLPCEPLFCCCLFLFVIEAAFVTVDVWSQND
jgi:uncharacterized protein YihD (DUF1040 family)